MPEERTYTIRGQNPSGTTHKKIQLSNYDPKAEYLILDFKIMPAGTPTNSDCYGIVTMGQNSSIDPSDPDFADQNQIAWAHHTVMQRVPPGVGEGVLLNNYEINDEKLFGYDIWLHTEDVLGNEAVNYFLKIKKYNVDAVTGSIASLRQFQYNSIE